MYCKYCGKEIADDSIFCKHCGKKVIIIESSPAEENSYEEADETVHNDDSEQISPPDKDNTEEVESLKAKSNGNVIAREIVANLKMIAFAAIVWIAYITVAYFIRYNDSLPIEDKHLWGSSCYDPKYLEKSLASEYGDSFWEYIFFRDIYVTPPYSTWTAFDKMVGFPANRGDYNEALVFCPSNSSAALEQAREDAQRKKLPKSYIEDHEGWAKEEADRNIKQFCANISSIRRNGFNEYMSKNMKWCAIISLCFFILGRYVIKFGRWVSSNS